MRGLVPLLLACTGAFAPLHAQRLSPFLFRATGSRTSQPQLAPATPEPRHVFREILLAPYVGTALLNNYSYSVLGAHVEWAPVPATRLAARYGWNVDDRGNPAGSASVDLAQRLVGNDTATVAFTAGWAHLGREDRGMLGFRLMAVAARTADGVAGLGLWADVRSTFRSMRDLQRVNSRLWLQFTIAVPVWLLFGH